MSKMRFYTTPSSIASYFGVGFNTPEDQLAIDLALTEPVFDDATRDRMKLGKFLEDATLNYFEDKLGIVITDRNDKYLELYDGKIIGKVDGRTVIDGIETIVENKISNAQNKFTDELAYLFQVQAYMIDGTPQVLLCGLHQGRPIYKIIKRDEEMIADIKEMTDFIVNVLMGFEDFSNYPTHLLEKYSQAKILQPFEEVTEEQEQEFIRLIELKEQIKELEAEAKLIENKIKDNFGEGKWEAVDELGNKYSVTLSETTRKGGIDLDKLSIENPGLDLTKYAKPDTTFKTLRTSLKRPKH